MNFAINTKHYKASDIFSYNQVKPLPGLPSFLNLHFKSAIKDKTPLIGPGIYIVAFDGEPVYLGKYLGVQDAPFSGNVINLRWSKHIATLTLRGKRLSMSQRALQQSLEMAPKSAIVRALNNVDKEMLHRDRGCQTTARRLNFAHKNWGDFASLDNITLERFTFTYIRLTPNAEDISTPAIRQFVSEAESSLINDFYLPCNSTAIKSAELEKINLDDLVAVTQKLLTQSQSTQEISEKDAAPDLTRNDINSDKDAQEELLNPFEVRLEKAQNWAREFVAGLISHFEDKDAVEVHYTNTNNGDMRLRVYWQTPSGSNKSQNFATLEWHDKGGTFLINTEAAAKDLNDLSMTVRANTLPAQLKLTEAVYQEKEGALNRLFENAALLIKARHGGVQL